MTQVWLQLIAIGFVLAANPLPRGDTVRAWLYGIAVFFTALSIILFFVNGGTTG